MTGSLSAAVCGNDVADALVVKADDGNTSSERLQHHIAAGITQTWKAEELPLVICATAASAKGRRPRNMALGNTLDVASVP